MMMVRDKSFKAIGSVHLRVHLGQGVFLPEGGWTVEVNTEGEKGTAGRRGLCTHRPTGCWSPQSSSFIPRQTGIVCASGQTTWTPECQVTVPCLARLCLSAAHTTTVGPHHPVTFKVLVSLFLRF